MCCFADLLMFCDAQPYATSSTFIINFSKTFFGMNLVTLRNLGPSRIAWPCLSCVASAELWPQMNHVTLGSRKVISENVQVTLTQECPWNYLCPFRWSPFLWMHYLPVFPFQKAQVLTWRTWPPALTLPWPTWRWRKGRQQSCHAQSNFLEDDRQADINADTTWTEFNIWS